MCKGPREKAAFMRLFPSTGEKGTVNAARGRCCWGIRGKTVAKIIEYYIPSTFRKSGKWVPAKERGKIIEFEPETKKTA